MQVGNSQSETSKLCHAVLACEDDLFSFHINNKYDLVVTRRAKERNNKLNKS